MRNVTVRTLGGLDELCLDEICHGEDRWGNRIVTYLADDGNVYDSDGDELFPLGGGAPLLVVGPLTTPVH